MMCSIILPAFLVKLSLHLDLGETLKDTNGFLFYELYPPKALLLLVLNSRVVSIGQSQFTTTSIQIFISLSTQNDTSSVICNCTLD